MTNEQFQMVEESYGNGDALVFKVGERVFVCEEALKHRKEATVEMVDCSEIDETCVTKSGEYYGDVISAPSFTMILADPYADYPDEVATIYYEDELREVIAQ